MHTMNRLLMSAVFAVSVLGLQACGGDAHVKKSAAKADGKWAAHIAEVDHKGMAYCHKHGEKKHCHDHPSVGKK